MTQPAPGRLRFLDFLRERRGFTTDDTLASLLPLFRQVAQTHESGKVAPLDGAEDLLVDDYRVYSETTHAREPRSATARLRALERQYGNALDIVSQSIHTTDADQGDQELTDLLVARPADGQDQPRYVAGYRSWEHLAGHHDALTDMYVLGLLLASVACGFDFTDASHVETFAQRRRNLFSVVPHLNPVLARHIVRLTELDRHRRAQDLNAVVESLARYREQDAGLEMDLSAIPGFHDADVSGRRRMVLSRLRERLFEISRRNRLLYFKPSLQSLNLTFASVPILFDVRSIRPEQLFTWQKSVESELVSGQPIPLNRYLRFEDAPYVPSVLDKLISEARRDKVEFGFSQLRLVVCFLRWNNLKDPAHERIDSPLLLLPVELLKKRGVRDSYVLSATSQEAEVNPVLRYYFKQLYDIDLPFAIDLGETTIQAFYDTLVKQIEATEPGVVLNRVDRPVVDLVYKRARRRLDQYRRRLRVRGVSLKSFRELDYSYSRDNYQPLGLRIFTSMVRPSPAPLRDIFREGGAPREAQMVASEPRAGHGEKQKTIAAFREGGGDGNPYSWDFDLCSLTLGNFNYRKMSLVRDYNQLLETDQENAPFDAIFSLAPRATQMPTPDGVMGLEHCYPVVSCDPTQLHAVMAAQNGSSYIIQGPPGTGKSQTITNLIANLVAHGKRVLFVCEKRAAIDVVYHRLRQRGLHHLVCLIHDSQADKRDFIQDLRACYERLLGSESGSDDAARERRACLEAMEREIRPIATFGAAMRSAPDAAGTPLRRLLGRLVALADRRLELSPSQEALLPCYRLWVEARDQLEPLARRVRETCPDGIFARHPLASLSPAVTKLEAPRLEIERELGALGLMLAEIRATCESHGIELQAEETLSRLLYGARYASEVKPLADQNLLALLDPASPASAELRDLRQDHARAMDTLKKARETTVAWRKKLDAQDLESALEQCAALGTGLLRVLKPQYWTLRRILNERYDISRHAVKPTWQRVLEGLRSEYAAAAAVESLESEARARYGTTAGLESFATSVEGVRSAVNRLLAGTQAAVGDRLSDSPRAVAGLASLRSPLEDVERRLAALFGADEGASLERLESLLARQRENLHLLPDWLPCLAELASLPTELARAIRSIPLDLAGLEAASARRTIDEFWHREHELMRFSGANRDRSAARLDKLQVHWLETNAETILAQTRARFAERVALASRPSIRLSKDEEAFKRRYNAGRRELEHEFGKTMRYKSVRGLLAGAAGQVISDLKPVWLMSPLSVSDTLPLDSGMFDAVIFDEASQVTLEEAIPALFRAEQVVISGDQMQLPPTNFFSASRTGEDTLLLEDEEDGGVVEYELDANSFLSHAARNLSSTMLGWHYRSRSESLISFSNAAFYEGKLLTVPDQQGLRNDVEPIRVATAQDGSRYAAALMERAVSFHHLEHGRYIGRTNLHEAAYIAELVRALLEREGRPTIGIVAFSEAQQTAIETALERLADTDKGFCARLEEEYAREDDGQFSGLLVKNLENIQGDERDVVILSVCYAYGADNRMRMNFGPINQSGGEKRLNVAFSRAKAHMAVVSSIMHSAITNVYNDGANALRFYLQYAAAMSSGDLRTAANVLRVLNPSGRGPQRAPSHDAVASGVEAALRDRGLEVVRDVGQSRFRCDLAVGRPGASGFGLGIFVDTERFYEENDVLEREVLKPRLLRAFGWSVAHVLAKDWLADPQGVVDHLLRQLDGESTPEVENVEALLDVAPPELEGIPAPPEPAAVSAPAPDPPATETDSAEAAPREAAEPELGSERHRESTPPEVPNPAEPPPELAADPPAPESPAPGGDLRPLSTLAPGATRLFELIAGRSKKYWHVTVDGTELVVSFGRIGTQGQLKRKPFPSEDAARLEGERLIRQKLAKGYREVDG